MTNGINREVYFLYEPELKKGHGSKKMIKTLGQNVFYVSEDDKVEVYSYNTKVFTITEEGEFQRNWHGWSITTQRHINKVLVELGYPTINKEMWNEMPIKFS